MKVTVKSVNGTREVPFKDNSSVLEALETSGIDVHYHCREGFCGACRCKLKKGKVKYVIDPLAFIDDDEFLPCCSVPEGDIDIEVL